MTNLDHIDEDKILQAIKEGVCEAMKQVMPSKQRIIEAISDGIYKSMPWPSEIGEQIYHGTKDAHK